MMRKLLFLTEALLLFLASQAVSAQEGVPARTLSNPRVKAIAQDADGYIWFGTDRGLNRYNGSTYTVFYASSQEGALNNDNILSLCQDGQGTLWIGTECGLNWYRDGLFHHLNATVFDPVDRIAEVDSLRITFRSKSGVFVMDKESLAIEGHTPTEDLPAQDQASDSPVRFTDRDGGVWVTDDRDGWSYTAPRQPFRSVELAPDNLRISHLVPDAQGYVWLRVGDKFSCFSPRENRIVWQDTEHACGGLFMDTDGHLVVVFDRNTVANYTVHNGIPHLNLSVRSDGEVYSVSPGKNGSLWLSGASEIRKVDPEGNRERFRVERPFSYILPSPGDGRIFIVGLKDGLLEVLPDGSVVPFGEGFQNVSALLMARDGTFWMGTYNDGLIHFDEAKGTVERFDSASGVMVGDVKSLVQDREGSIWISTATHLSRYDPWTRTLTAMQDSRYREGRFYDLISSAIGPDGKLYFGGSGGLTIVDPGQFQPAQEDTPLKMESITVNDVPYSARTEKLVLPYDENTVSFRFAGIDFSSGSLLNYAWRLDGYESEWHSGNLSPHAVYTKLPPGQYTFNARVRVQNGEWSPSVISLPVTIRPAPWASPWAKALYWILVLGLLATGVGFFIRYRTQKDRLALASQREEMHQQHIDFMTNISHEFRTPLSMIFAPAKELEKSELPPHEREMVNLISRNADRLRTLSEQLLSSGGREAQESLTLRENDLTSLLRSTAQMFRHAASEKEQELTADLPETCIGLYDTEKVSKVIGNLLSNAVKYTPEGGHIRLALKQEDGNAVITVTDDGIGIPEEKRGRIFDRFDRLGAENTRVIGSGIGLNYAQGLARVHKGSLTYAPNEPKGSVFRFVFPIDTAAYPEWAEQEVPAETETAFVSEEGGEKVQTILIAEDTAELRQFLGTLFQHDYNVILASDGLEAEDNLQLSLPDLVLTDVVMPGKTGYALCSDIKAHPDWNHIPVILLTAKADAASSVEGMKAGADAYVPKPFDPDFLKATVESILRNRRILQEKVRNLTSADLQDPEKAEEIPLTSAEKAFLEKVHAYLDANLDNVDADVAGMADELCMSYSSLYAKVKALTGETPKAYSTAYRMNIARQLLLSGEWTVSEVADKVGASSPSTFSREFKKHFGEAPSQIKRT